MGISKDKKQISLAEARENAGLTLEEAARRMKVSVNVIVGWERGHRELEISEAKKLSMLYMIDLDNIYFSDVSKNI